MASEAELISLTKYTVGPPLAGIFMNMMLYGVMVTQTFFYYSTYSRDQMWIKIYVGVLFLADTLNSIFNIWWAYHVFINNFGSVDAVTVANWLFETEEAMAGIIAMQVQLFYAWRLHKLGASKWISGCVAGLSICSCLAAIGTSINIGIKPIITNFAHYKAIVIVWLVSSTVADVAVAFALTWRLRRSITGYAQTDTVISRVIHITMSNGLLIAAFALADMIAFLATAGGLHLAFNYALIKLYGNSAMTTLNSRAISFSSVDNPKAIRMSSVQPRQNINGNNFAVARTNLPKIARPSQVVVNVETHEIVDAPTGRVNTDDEEWTHSESEVTETKVLAI